MCTGYFGERKKHSESVHVSVMLISPNQNKLKVHVKSMNTQSPLELQKLREHLRTIKAIVAVSIFFLYFTG